MQKFIATGNLTRDAELSTSSNGTTICKFSLAVKRDYKNENGEYDTDFFNITVFGKKGESCGKYLKKGSKCCIIGRLQNNSYEKDGVKQYSTQIIANEVEFLSSQNSGSQPATNSTQPELTPIDDDSLPF